MGEQEKTVYGPSMEERERRREKEREAEKKLEELRLMNRSGPANAPATAQYQLWIVDPTRDAFPVDGGVFNVADYVAQDGKAYVPIDAKLRVDQPAAFASTLEQPGGVVKSNNALLVVAAVEYLPG